MKKTILTIVAVLAGLNIYAQGTVTLSNIGGKAVTNTVTSASVVSGTTFNVGLYYAPDGTSDEGQFTLVGAVGTSFTAPGFYNCGARTAPTPVAGGFGMFQVRVWSTAFGNSYEQVLATGNSAAFVGKSGILRIDTGDPTTVPPGSAASMVAAGLQPFVVSPVPEPSVIGLGLLGIGALALLRRRN